MSDVAAEIRSADRATWRRGAGASVPLLLALALLLGGCGRAHESPAQKRARCQAAWDNHVPPPAYEGDPKGAPYVNECAAQGGGRLLSPQTWETQCQASLVCAGQFGQTRTGREHASRPGAGGPSPDGAQTPP